MQRADDAAERQATPQQAADSASSPPAACRSSTEQQQQQQARTSRVRAKRSRNLARERLQSELKQMRTLATELEQRCGTLQQQRGSRLSREERAMRVAAWEYIAKCQQQERTRVEAENALLKELLRSQLATARQIQHEVRQFPSTRPEEHAIMSLGLPRRACDSLADGAVYEALSVQVDAAFARMDSVFEQNELSDWRATASQAQVKVQRSSTVDGSLHIELVDVDVFPFDKELVFKAFWQCWQQHYMATNCVVYELPGASNSQWRDAVAVNMQIEVAVDGEQVPLEIMFVLKLATERDRIRYVWRSTSRENARFPGVYIDETGWEELRTIPVSEGDSSAVEGTMILSCSQLQSKASSCGDAAAASDTQSELEVAALLVKLMISSYEAMTVDMSCEIMDVLLEETGVMLPQVA